MTRRPMRLRRRQVARLSSLQDSLSKDWKKRHPDLAAIAKSDEQSVGRMLDELVRQPKQPRTLRA